jgi:exoribonuclease R
MVSSISDLVKNFKNQRLDANGFTINTYKPQALNSSKLTNIKLQHRNENKSARKPRNQVSGIFHHIVFEPYWALDDVQRALNANELVKSKIRINQRNFKDAYLNDTLNDKNLDIYINSVKDRNRALNGDIVAAKIKEKHEWKIVNSKLVCVTCLHTRNIST